MKWQHIQDEFTAHWVGYSSEAPSMNENPDWVVCVLHGLGAQGVEFKDMIEPLAQQWKCSTQWHILQAPDRPVTRQGGAVMPAWYDVYDLSLDSKQDTQGIHQAADQLHQWCHQQVQAGIPSKKIILMGFSQGGALALYSALTLGLPLGGVVALSTYLPLKEELEAMSIEQTAPICLMHGTQDTVLTPEFAETTQAYLTQSYPGALDVFWYPMAHTVCMAQLIDLKDWLLRLH